MRTRTVLALSLLLPTALAGCARGATGNDPGVASAANGKPTPSASVSAQPAGDAPLKYSQCMREHGMTWFPDPKKDGEMTLRIPDGIDKSKMDAAEQACRQWAPNGGNAPKLDAAALEQLRLMAKCMRENGVPNFPDPKPDGQLAISADQVGAGPGDPTFDKAEKICDKYRPSPPPGAAGQGGTTTGRRDS